MATIYLSSTYTDLKECREVVYHALLQMRHDAIAMEDYVATDQRPTEKCLADVAASDLYIGIFAWRYGYIPSEMNPDHKSITELEYRKAIHTGKHCLLFLLHDDAPWPTTAMDAQTGEGTSGECIKALRRELAQEKMVSFFRTPEELAKLAIIAVNYTEQIQLEKRLKDLTIDHIGFIYSRLESFVGREQELAAIRKDINALLPTGGYLTITGQAGQGKSSIIARIVQDYSDRSAGVAEAVPTSPFLPTVAAPECRGCLSAVCRSSANASPSGAGQALSTTPRQGQAFAGAPLRSAALTWGGTLGVPAREATSNVVSGSNIHRSKCKAG